MPIRNKHQRTVSLLWLSITAVVGILLGIGSTYVSLYPTVSSLSLQGGQYEAIIQEQSRQISALRSSALPRGPLIAQEASREAAYRASTIQTTTEARHISADQETLTESTLKAGDVKETRDVSADTSHKSISSPPKGPAVEASTPPRTATPPDKKPVTNNRPEAKPLATKPPPSATSKTPPLAIDAVHPEAANAARLTMAQRSATTNTPTSMAAAPSSALPSPTTAAVPIEGKPTINATLAQANIVGMDGSSVTFKTGLKVQVGNAFPTGERLLSVNPGTKRIETDRRVIYLNPDEPKTE